jgi:DNA-binding LacI/PurR family transcriptional regulator
MALGVIAGLARRGKAVPHDVSVIGFDDVPMAAMVAPPLTTIRLPTEEAGTVAVTTLREASTATSELVGTLVVRESTGPVTKRRASADANGAQRPSDAGPG